MEFSEARNTTEGQSLSLQDLLLAEPEPEHANFMTIQKLRVNGNFAVSLTVYFLY